MMNMPGSSSSSSISGSGSSGTADSVVSLVSTVWQNSASAIRDNAFTLAVSAGSLGVVTLVAFAIREKRRYRDQCPIPLTCPEKCHLLLGHVSMFGGNKLEGTQELMVDNADEDGLSCFYFLNSLWMGVTKAEHLKEVYMASSDRLPNPLDHHVMRTVGYKSLLLTNGDEWKVQRHIISKAFRWESLQEMVTTMNETGLRLVAALEKASRSSSTVNITPIMKLATLDVIGETAFGFRFDSLASFLEGTGGSGQHNRGVELAEAVQFLNEEFPRRVFTETMNPFAQFYWLPCAANTKHRRSRQLVLDTLKDIIDARRRAVKEGGQCFKDMLSHVLDAHDDDTNQGLDDESLNDNLFTLLFAGFETSSIVLTYLFYIVAKYPEVEAKCVGEIGRVLGKGGLPSHQDLMVNLPYCHAVVQETLRLYPPAPVTTRSLSKPLTLASEGKSKPVTLPAGCYVMIPIYQINRSPRNYSNPEEFIPERFLPDNIHSINRYANITFSAGGRDCIGRRFAVLEQMSLFVVVLQRLKFRLSKPDYVVKPITLGLMQCPEGGMPLFVERR
jgi:cytochrome P450